MSQRLRSAPPGKEIGRFGSAETLRETASRCEGIQDHTRLCKRSASILGRFALTFAGLAGFLVLIAAAGLAAGLVSGLPGLVLYGGIFLVVLMAAARAEGIL
jgi:hypothetical protein